jgi:hypothetical protein
VTTTTKRAIDAITTAATCVVSNFLDEFCWLTGSLVADFTVPPVVVGRDIEGSVDWFPTPPNIEPATLL